MRADRGLDNIDDPVDCKVSICWEADGKSPLSPEESHKGHGNQKLGEEKRFRFMALETFRLYNVSWMSYYLSSKKLILETFSYFIWKLSQYFMNLCPDSLFSR